MTRLTTKQAELLRLMNERHYSLYHMDIPYKGRRTFLETPAQVYFNTDPRTVRILIRKGLITPAADVAGKYVLSYAAKTQLEGSQ